MKTQELLELAALDALGLLEEHEREAFDRAFRAAPPALQAQIRGEQTRIAKDDSLLPEVDAPIGLKSKVLARWRDAIAARRRILPPLLPSSGVSSVWRMAAIGSLAAAIVMGVASLQIHTNFKQLAAASNDLDKSRAMVEVLGVDYSRWVLGDTQKVAYEPVAEDFPGRVAMFVDAKPAPNSGACTAMFICQQFPASAVKYQVVVMDKAGQIIKDKDGKMQVVDTFEINNETGSMRQFKVSITVEVIGNDYDLAIIVPKQDNKVIGKLRLDLFGA